MALSSATLAFALSAIGSSNAHAQQVAVQGEPKTARPADSANNREQLRESWAKLRGELVEANELLSADVSNGLNPVGQVTDLVLTPDGKQVQYILYETPYPYSFYGAEDGFVRYDGVEIEHGAVFDTTVRFEPVEAPPGAPEELELTREQAQERLASRIIGDEMQFADDAAREIEDILIDKDTGAIIHYVVETDSESIFRAARRTVPAARVTIEEDGQITAALRLRELDDLQIYDPALL